MEQRPSHPLSRWLNPLQIIPSRIRTSRILALIGNQRESDNPSAFSAFQTYFEQSPNLKFTGVQGVGFNGGILIFTETGPLFGFPGRKISVKFALNQDQEELLLIERLYLEMFEKLEHFAQMIRLPDTSINFGSKKHYMVATEYLPGGSLAQFRERTRLAGRPIPNRVIWHILRCLVRQTCGLQFPPQIMPTYDPNAPVLREEAFPIPRPQRFTITHNAMTQSSFRFADPHPLDDEHSFFPIIKTTNLSKCRFEADVNDADILNLRDIGQITMELALNSKPLELFNKLGEDGRATQFTLESEQMNRLYPHEQIPPTPIWTDADTDFLQAPGIDPALKENVAMLMSVNENYLVSRPALFNSINDSLANRSWEKYLTPDRAAVELSDEAEREFVKQFIYDADITQGGVLGDVADIMGPVRWRDDNLAALIGIETEEDEWV